MRPILDCLCCFVGQLSTPYSTAPSAASGGETEVFPWLIVLFCRHLRHVRMVSWYPLFERESCTAVGAGLAGGARQLQWHTGTGRKPPLFGVWDMSTIHPPSGLRHPGPTGRAWVSWEGRRVMRGETCGGLSRRIGSGVHFLARVSSPGLNAKGHSDAFLDGSLRARS